MNLKELKTMIAEEYTKYLDEQPVDPAGLPPMTMDPTVNVSDTDIDMEGGDSEATLRQIYDMLKSYFEGGAAAAPAGDMDMDDMEDMEDMDDMGDADDMAGDAADAADDADDDDDDVSEKKEDDDDSKKDKEDLKERFKKLANIIKG